MPLSLVFHGMTHIIMTYDNFSGLWCLICLHTVIKQSYYQGRRKVYAATIANNIRKVKHMSHSCLLQVIQTWQISTMIQKQFFYLEYEWFWLIESFGILHHEIKVSLNIVQRLVHAVLYLLSNHLQVHWFLDHFIVLGIQLETEIW